MKIKIGVAAVAVLLVALQLVFGGKGGGPAPAVPAAPAADGSAPGGEPAPAAAPALPAPGEVTGILIDGSVALGKTDAGWRAPGPAPASAEKIGRFLAALLAGESSPVAPSADPEETGVDGGGVAVVLAAGPGESSAFVIGLHPENDFNSTYVKTPDGETVLAAGDLRAELGMWRNSPGEKPDPGVWLDTRVLRFDPGQVVSLAATYPDHEITFAKRPGVGGNAAPVWTPAFPVPGGEWSGAGLRLWLEELADFRIAGIAGVPPAAGAPAKDGREHAIVLGFADGSRKSVRAIPGHADGDAVAVVSDHPEQAFVLPGWRFRNYFHRLDSLFPGAVPAFDPADVRLLDIRHGGDSVKIRRAGEGWEPVALPYAAKAERVDRLARFLAAWRPEDYAGARASRPVHGGSTVEVVLADGGVHQYRLSGRHPVFPWRSVTLDGGQVFSVTDAEAGVMFPRFADILELGAVFGELEDAPASAFELEDVAGELRIRFARDGGGGWFAETAAGTLPLDTAGAEALAGELRSWRVAGFSLSGLPDGEPDFRVSVESAGKERAAAALFRPVGREIPFIAGDAAPESGGGREGLLLDRAEFHNWLTAVRDIARRVDERAAEEAEKKTEAGAEKAAAAQPSAGSARKIVPAEVDFSGRVSEKAAAGTADESGR